MCCHYQKYKLQLSKTLNHGAKFLAKSKTLERKKSDWTSEQGIPLPLVECAFIFFQACGKQLLRNLYLNNFFHFLTENSFSFLSVLFVPVCMVQIFRIWHLLEPFISWSTVFIAFYLKVFFIWFTWSKIAGKICGLAGLWRPHPFYSLKRPQTPDTNFPSYPHHLNFGSSYTEGKTLGFCLALKHCSHFSPEIIDQNIHYLCSMVSHEDQ